MRAPIGPLTRLVKLARPRLQALDVRVMQRIARVATSCQNMATAIAEQYGVSARIIHPPIRVSDYSIGLNRGDFYLTVSRLIAHKRVDLAIEACMRLGRKLVVVGDGPDAARMRSIADGTVRFAGRVSDETLRQLYRTCRALIFPSREDFGLAPLEAQASGSPVVAYGVGGVRETMIEGRTGVFFGSQDSEALVEAILRLEQAQFDAGAIRESVRRFDVEYFKQKLRDFVLG